MEFIIIIIVTLILALILKVLFEYNMKKIKHIADDEYLDEVANKFPRNIEICKKYLKMLKNESVEIEESDTNQASLYIAITNKIIIANISKTYTRIQTIAHECLHSVQDRKILMFNFIYSNIYLIYFAVICILALFKILPYNLMFLSIFIILSLVYFMTRMYLENDAMIKARFLAKEYIENEKYTTQEENDKLIEGFDKINRLGMKVVHYNLFLQIAIKIIIFSLICIIR